MTAVLAGQVGRDAAIFGGRRSFLVVVLKADAFAQLLLSAIFT